MIPRTYRSMLMPLAAAGVALAMAAGPVAAQDASPDAMADETMEAREQMDTGLVVHDPWTRASMMIDLANAAYMVIHNNTDIDDALVGVSSPAAGIAEIHQTSMDDEGAMSMMPVESVPIPAHGDAVLEAGGYHIMLINLVEALDEGEAIEVTLEFADAEPQTVELPVLATGPMSDMDMDDDMGMQTDDDDDA